MSVVSLTDQTLVQLYALHIGEAEDGMHEVGRVETGDFISLPAEGVEIIKWLQAGLTLGDIKERFNERFGQPPDLDDFLEGLATCGFVRSVNGVEVPQDEEGEDAHISEVVLAHGLRLFANLPSARIAWLLSTPMQATYLAIWIAAPILFLMHPMFPTAESALVFPSVIANAVLLTLLGYLLVFLHQCAHMLAVRAHNCSSTLTISNRLYFLVVQADMSSVRTLPRNQRYGPYLAGMTFDMTVLLLCSALRMLNLGGPWPGALTFLLLSSIFFQLAFFMRTDIYYVISNWLHLDNLMQGTQHWLINRVCRSLKRSEPYDLSAIPERELHYVQWYANFYVVGIFVAVAELALIILPLLYQMIRQAFEGMRLGLHQIAFWDGLAFIVLMTFNLAALLYVAWRNHYSTFQ